MNFLNEGPCIFILHKFYRWSCSKGPSEELKERKLVGLSAFLHLGALAWGVSAGSPEWRGREEGLNPKSGQGGGERLNFK